MTHNTHFSEKLTGEAQPHTTETKSVALKQAFPVSPLMGVVAVVAIYFGAMIAGQMLVGTLPAFFGWSVEQIDNWLEQSAYAQFIYVVLVEGLTLSLLYIFMRSRQLKWADIGLLRPRLRDAGATLLAYPPYFLMNAAAVIAATAVFHLDSGQRQQTGFENARSVPELIITFISLVVLPPLVEEIVMRGFLFSSLKRGLKVVPAALLTSVIFASAHLQFGQDAPLLWLAAIDTFILSLVLCYLRQRTGSLWAGIGLHALKNCLAFIVLFVLPQINIMNNF
jgi:membrane protease YdiL (CAAX protease family)